jgi:hypothetical protein
MFTRQLHVEQLQDTAGIRYVVDQKLHRLAHQIVEQALVKHAEIIFVEAVKHQHPARLIARYVVKVQYPLQDASVVV